MHPEKLFFIYVAKNEEWKKGRERIGITFHRCLDFTVGGLSAILRRDLNVEAEILPVIPGKPFDRMSISYLSRDHLERGKSVYHFYLTYFKPFWTDCQTEGYAAENFGMIYWKRLEAPVSDSKRVKFFADMNCAKALSCVMSRSVTNVREKEKGIF